VNRAGNVGRWRRRSLVPAVAVFIFVTAACSSGGARSTAAPSTVAASSTTSIAPACASDRPPPVSRVAYTFRFAGHDRSYLLALPDDYDGRTADPLVLDFAGFAGTKESQEAFTQMGAKGVARGFVVVTPDALGTPRQWNEFAIPSQPDDFAFIHALVADLEHRLCIDPDRVYAAGHSNGSAFAGFLVCRAPHVFAAVAMVSATTPAGCPTGVAPAVLAIAGTADASVPYAGGLVAGSTIPIPAARTTISFYAARYQCRQPPEQTRLGAGVTQIRYSDCIDGAEVTLDTIAGGTHTWPGGPAALADSHDSAAGKTFGATVQILDFFARHRRAPSR
jgi:polyhydroxybutyrate depolymerase